MATKIKMAQKAKAKFNEISKSQTQMEEHFKIFQPNQMQNGFLGIYFRLKGSLEFRRHLESGRHFKFIENIAKKIA